MVGCGRGTDKPDCLIIKLTEGSYVLPCLAAGVPKTGFDMRGARAEELLPEDQLWLSILDRTPRYGDLSDEAARAELSEGGFPERVIQAYLAARARSAPTRKARSTAK